MLREINDWRFKYICRETSNDFSKEFLYSGNYWYKEYPFFDIPKSKGVDDNFRHVLQVELYEEGPLSGCIKAIRARHYVYGITEDWQDHRYEYDNDLRDPTPFEIREYEQILDRCTSKYFEKLELSVLEWFKSIVASHIVEAELIKGSALHLYDAVLRLYDYEISLGCAKQVFRLGISYIETFLLGNRFVNPSIGLGSDAEGNDEYLFMNRFFDWNHNHSEEDIIELLTSSIDVKSFYSYFCIDVDGLFENYVNDWMVRNHNVWQLLGMEDVSVKGIIAEKLALLKNDASRVLTFPSSREKVVENKSE